MDGFVHADIPVELDRYHGRFFCWSHQLPVRRGKSDQQSQATFCCQHTALLLQGASAGAVLCLGSLQHTPGQHFINAGLELLVLLPIKSFFAQLKGTRAFSPFGLVPFDQRLFHHFFTCIQFCRQDKGGVDQVPYQALDIMHPVSGGRNQTMGTFSGQFARCRYAEQRLPHAESSRVLLPIATASVVVAVPAGEFETTMRSCGLSPIFLREASDEHCVLRRASPAVSFVESEPVARCLLVLAARQQEPCCDDRY